MTEPAYISREEAIRRVRAATGLSKDTCRTRVYQLPALVDGKREKVAAMLVRAVITELCKPPEMPVTPTPKVRPLSSRQRAHGEAVQVIGRLQARIK